MSKNNDPLKIQVAREPIAADLPLPRFMSQGAAAIDIRAALATPVTIRPNERALIDTGLRLAIPVGYEGQIRPRSGLAIKEGIAVLNSPGTIDSDYRGLLRIILINLGTNDFVVHHGDRIAQLVIAPVINVELIEVNDLDETARGDGGFGSSGLK